MSHVQGHEYHVVKLNSDKSSSEDLISVLSRIYFALQHNYFPDDHGDVSDVLINRIFLCYKKSCFDLFVKKNPFYNAH